jgi:peptide/nickel transport system substrate-binding protein
VTRHTRTPFSQRAATRTRGLPYATGLAAALLLASCSNTPQQSSATSQTGSYAYISTGPTTDYIFPLSQDSQTNETFQYQLYRPLYWFGGVGDGAPVFNGNFSLATPPTFSSNGLTVTVHLKHYVWSDGKPVTARDVQFFMNLVKAEKDIWSAYVPGFFPDNIVSTTAPNPDTVVFHLSQSYGTNSTWFLYNELSQITPLPQQTWDRTSTRSPVGNYDLTPSGARKVWNFLEAQSVDVGTYGTNPLWTVVDGPWRLESFTESGLITLVPNRRYSGPDRPHLSEFQEIPFASRTAELNQLLSAHNIDVGSIPFEDVKSEGPVLRADGYTLKTIYPWAINFFPINYHNATFGPIISQLYVRQAFQSLIDQPSLITSALSGFGTAVYGPVPREPANPFVSATESSNPYPFDPSRARALLSSHGWAIHPNGVTTCMRPGDLSSECGSGIPAGAKMSFTLEFASGSTSRLLELEFVKGDFAQLGIQLSLSPTTNLNYSSCTPTQSACHWQLVQGGVSWTYFPDVYPSGGEILSTGAVGNPGSYSNPKVDALVDRARAGSLPALHALESYAAKDLPDLWLPVPATVVVYKSTLRGIVPEDSLGNIYPSTWSFKG